MQEKMKIYKFTAHLTKYEMDLLLDALDRCISNCYQNGWQEISEDYKKLKGKFEGVIRL
jgi:hypothetical protein